MSLAPMLEILHGIACPESGSSSIQTSATTKKYLKAKSEAMSGGRSGATTDMNALKEKLKLHVGTRALQEQGKSAVDSNNYARPGPFSHRTHLTNDFLLIQDQDSHDEINIPKTNERKRNVGSLACVPV